MRIRHYKDVEPTEDIPGVFRRVVIGPDEGAPTFVMRIFELDPGCSTPYHTHDWEHEIFVLAGKAAVKGRDGETPLSEGTAVFVAPNEEHCFINTGDSVLRVMCLIPVEARPSF